MAPANSGSQVRMRNPHTQMAVNLQQSPMACLETLLRKRL